MIIKRIGNQDVILTEPEKDILLAGYIAEKSLKESAELVEQEENDDNQTEEDL
jgi:hypothetical protein